MRNRDQLRADFAVSGSTDYLVWLAQQPEGDRAEGKTCFDSDEQKISRGVGDTVAKITSAVGIKPCGGCKKRQQKLNEFFPYR
jgi:hypothetical protein